ncbi:hypothetical protein LSAT2_026298 [Lamellibrachia satsuma]|nr:hypothetical protein LSAT2_026298 [Lamellibrachia satsuma]
MRVVIILLFACLALPALADENAAQLEKTVAARDRKILFWPFNTELVEVLVAVVKGVRKAGATAEVPLVDALVPTRVCPYAKLSVVTNTLVEPHAKGIAAEGLTEASNAVAVNGC